MCQSMVNSVTSTAPISDYVALEPNVGWSDSNISLFSLRHTTKYPTCIIVVVAMGKKK